MKTVFIFITALYGLFFLPESINSGSLKIQIDNLKNDQGQIGVLIFTTKTGYPDQNEHAYRSMFIPIQDKIPVITIDDLPYGDYTITIMHDENNNGIFDKTTFSIPKEGYGVSNNPKPRVFGPPHFKDGIIKVSSDITTIKIQIRYHD